MTGLFEWMYRSVRWRVNGILDRTVAKMRAALKTEYPCMYTPAYTEPKLGWLLDELRVGKTCHMTSCPARLTRVRRLVCAAVTFLLLHIPHVTLSLCLVSFEHVEMRLLPVTVYDDTLLT